MNSRTFVFNDGLAAADDFNLRFVMTATDSHDVFQHEPR
jgi:hypothetical protein